MLTVLYAEFKLRPNAETVLRDTRRQVYVVLVLVVMSWVAECICILKMSSKSRVKAESWDYIQRKKPVELP